MEASGRIVLIGAGDDCASGLKMVVECAPSLVILDADTNGEQTWQTVEQLKILCPHVAFCVVAHSFEQERRARAAGAGYVLQAGFSAETFFNAIEELTGCMSDAKDIG
jgi:DNA-binding NarL/FixJ family response regulator